MSGIQLFPVFLVGLLGSVHCVGMCGGIVGAFSGTAAPTAPAAPMATAVAGVRRPFPVPVVAAARLAGAIDGAIHALAYNTGRIISYALAGAIAGGVAGGAGTLIGLSRLQVGGYWLANLMLVVLGLYLTGAWRGLARLESAGQAAWRHIQPLMRHLLPLDRTWKVLALGGLWGWLPCGMVYSMLVTAMLSASAASGAAVMLAFGLGTLPMLLMIGLCGNQVRAWSRHRGVRTAGGLVVLAFGLVGLLRAEGGLPAPWLDALCISTPSMALP